MSVVDKIVIKIKVLQEVKIWKSALRVKAAFNSSAEMESFEDQDLLHTWQN